MTNNSDLMEYDEDDAVQYIQNYLPQDLKGKFTNDEINYVIDVIYDFYDEKGFMDESSDDEAVIEIDEDEMIAYVLKNTKKDKIKDFISDEIAFIIQGELAYCDSIGIFE